MAPMPGCRLEGSRHPVTQHPGLRGQSPSQNSTPGQTPWANCPSQCQPFQCPLLTHPPLHFLLHSTVFLLTFRPLNPSSQLCDPLSFYAAKKSNKYASIYRRDTDSKELNERPFRAEATQINRRSCIQGEKVNEIRETGKDSEEGEHVKGGDERLQQRRAGGK